MTKCLHWPGRLIVLVVRKAMDLRSKELAESFTYQHGDLEPLYPGKMSIDSTQHSTLCTSQIVLVK